MIITPRNEANENKGKILAKATYVGQLGLLFCSNFTNKARKKGWHSKPMPRSEAVKWKSNIFKGWDNEDVFFTA